MHDLIHKAMATGAIESLPETLVAAARKNPHRDWHTPLKEALTKRQITVGRNTFSVALFGIPLHGNLGMAYQPLLSTREMLKTALAAELFRPVEEGVVILDTLLPRDRITRMTPADIYNLCGEMFERGVVNRQNRLQSIIPAEDEVALNHAILPVVVYWKSKNALPPLVSLLEKRAKLADIVARFVGFEMASNLQPWLTGVTAQPMEPFLTATSHCSMEMVRRKLAELVEATVVPSESTAPLAANIKIMTIDNMGERYHIEIAIAPEGQPSPYALSMEFDELRDGNIQQRMNELMVEILQCGVKTAGFCYLRPESSLHLEALGETITYASGYLQ